MRRFCLGFRPFFSENSPLDCFPGAKNHFVQNDNVGLMRCPYDVILSDRRESKDPHNRVLCTLQRFSKDPP